MPGPSPLYTKFTGRPRGRTQNTDRLTLVELFFWFLYTDLSKEGEFHATSRASYRDICPY